MGGKKVDLTVYSDVSHYSKCIEVLLQSTREMEIPHLRSEVKNLHFFWTKITPYFWKIICISTYKPICWNSGERGS